MEEKFESVDEALKWISGLPKNDIIFFANIIRTLIKHRPMSSDLNTETIKQLQQEWKEKFESESSQQLETKEKEIQSLKLTEEEQKSKIENLSDEKNEINEKFTNYKNQSAGELERKIGIERMQSANDVKAKELEFEAKELKFIHDQNILKEKINQQKEEISRLTSEKKELKDILDNFETEAKTKLDERLETERAIFAADLANKIQAKELEITEKDLHLSNLQHYQQAKVQQHQVSIEGLNEKIKTLTESLGKSESEAKIKLEEKLAAEKEIAAANLENKIQAKELEVAAKDQRLNSVAQDLEKEKLKSSVYETQNKVLISEIKETILRQSGSSALIGENGENLVFQLLQNDPSIQVHNVAKGPGHVGDLVVSFKKSNIKAMLEVKNYKKEAVVNSEQRKKFFDDLETNSQYNCGILISLNGGFNDIDEFTFNKTSKERKPFVYIGHLATKKFPEDVLKFVLSLLKQYVEDDRANSVGTKILIETILSQIAGWNEALQDAQKNHKGAESQVKNLKKAEDNIQSKFNDIKSRWEMIQQRCVETDNDEPKRKMQKVE